MPASKPTSRLFAVFFVAVFMLALISPASAARGSDSRLAVNVGAPLPDGGILIDHNARDITQIPAQWIETAKQNVVWVFGSTSHGTQLTAGAEYLSANVAPPTYKFFKDWWTPPAQTNPRRLRLGYDDSWSWDAGTFLNDARERLNAAPSATAFMWSWCGQMSDAYLPYPGTVNSYLSAMQQLESEYPNVTFVYMTGHTDQWNPTRLNNNNNIIRQFAAANDKALYDFADIESYLPDGTRYATPNEDCPWCQSWCDTHPGDCPNPPISDCAHSHSLNCYMKGQAFWWLSARLAGWSGPGAGGPQTLTLRSQSVSDGVILESSESSNQGGTPNSTAATFNLGDGAQNKQYRAILHFNTATLPDNAVITKVTLKIMRHSTVGANPFLSLGAIRVDIRTGAFGDNNTLQTTDFQSAGHRNSAAVIQNTPVSNWYSVNFPSAAYAFLNLTGVTQFRLRFAIDDNNNGAADYLKFYSGNSTTAAARPTLIIEYHTP